MRSPAIPLLLIGLVAVGCDQKERTYPDKAPLPVTVMQLSETTPRAKRLYSGSVRSWKSEDLTFQVDGRVKWVLEPGTPVEGRTFRNDGSILSMGTQIAQLDQERFVTAVESARSKVRIETLRRDGLQIQVESSLPAELSAAQVQFELAQKERDRNERLVQQNAGAGKNLDRAIADFNLAKSKIDELKAKLLQAKAEVRSADAAIEQAQQALQDAERDLENTRLYSAFPGQIAAVQVVPGSLAGPNATVATVQMMNPIKVEVEISAEMSREMLPGENLTLGLITGQRKQQTVEASVYSIAPSADNSTRTFTLTLLVVNKLFDDADDDPSTSASRAKTRNLWRLGLGILPPVPSGMYYMPAKAIYADGKGDFVWKVTNFGADDPVQSTLRVEKLYIKRGDTRVPFLGKTEFQTVEVLPNQDFKPQRDLFTMELVIDGEETTEWDGDTVYLQRGQRWMLRPGDLAQIDLAREPQPRGIYVPVTAVHEDAGNTYVFLAEDGVAKKTEVSVDNVVGSSRHRITPVNDGINLRGKQIVVEGVHYLLDNQPISVVASKAMGATETRP